jgi:hypothetical protein
MNNHKRNFLLQEGKDCLLNNDSRRLLCYYFWSISIKNFCKVISMSGWIKSHEIWEIFSSRFLLKGNYLRTMKNVFTFEGKAFDSRFNSGRVLSFVIFFYFFIVIVLEFANTIINVEKKVVKKFYKTTKIEPRNKGMLKFFFSLLKCKVLLSSKCKTRWVSLIWSKPRMSSFCVE